MLTCEVLELEVNASCAHSSHAVVATAQHAYGGRLQSLKRTLWHCDCTQPVLQYNGVLSTCVFAKAGGTATQTAGCRSRGAKWIAHVLRVYEQVQT